LIKGQNLAICGEAVSDDVSAFTGSFILLVILSWIGFCGGDKN